MKNNKRKKLMIGVIVGVLVLTLASTFALWTYSRTLGDQTLISGDIFLKYTEGDTINIKEAMPSITYNPEDYFEFTVQGKNTYKKDVVFEILLDEGDKPSGEENKSRTERIKPELLKFRLVEIKDGKEEELIQAGSYNDLNKKRIWVDRVKANTTEEIKYTYRLYMWISSDAKIGNMEDADYTAEVWNNNVYASVKVAVNGDFNEKELTEDYMILNATNESGEPYDLKQPIQSDEDITITLGSKREVTKFVVEKSEQNPISTMSLEEPTDYTASYNEATRAWESKVTIDETGIYDYYAVYEAGKNSKTYSFTVLMNPDRFVKVEKPTSALCKQGLTYTGSPQDLITSTEAEGYTFVDYQQTDAGEYQVKAKLKDKFRWSDSSQEDATFNCAIGPKATTLTYEPTTKLSVAKGRKGIVKITAPTLGTFEVTSKASGTANATFNPSSGTSTTVTVNGLLEGATSLDVKFTPSNNNYTEITDTYSIEVTKQLASDIIKEKISSHTTGTCTPTIVDGDTTYFSGTNDCVNFNYVWYSGKLWRITAINLDNTMKMITQDEIAAIRWGEDTTYKDEESVKESWIYQWLNEDFLDTLENQESIIVQNSKWNVAEDKNSTPVKPSKTEETTIDGKVGLLNAYEYTQAYKNASTSTNYLNIGYFWWLITPYNSSYVRYVHNSGDFRNDSPSSFAYGVRPSVNLKSDINISGGAGTKENPYRIEGDKAVATVNDKLNSRVSGEYVNFDGKKYRIVGIENETTKLTSVDYVRDAEGAVMKKQFSSKSTDVLYASGTTTGTEYWAGYLNDTWYNNISETYRKMLVKGTYYLGQYGDKVSYKNSICSASNTTETTKECSKTSSIWNEGYVGLPRVGEMFSAMLGNGYTDTTTYIWLITPYSSSDVRVVNYAGYLDSRQPSSVALGVRPSINLNSNVIITSGEGTEQKPYDIKLAS